MKNPHAQYLGRLGGKAGVKNPLKRQTAETYAKTGKAGWSPEARARRLAKRLANVIRGGAK